MLKHKYIRLVDTLEAYESLIENRELEEAAVVAVTGDRDSVPDLYQFSVRTTNDDDLVKGNYNALDPVNHFGGLELIWGYFGWTWEDYQYNEDTLKGGHFIVLRDTVEYPRIYDGYRLQHINNLCSSLKKNTTIGYFDNSEVVSAQSAFVSSNRGYGKLDKEDNVWPKLKNAASMFYSSDNFSNWGDTLLYFPALEQCNKLFETYTLGRCPIVNFNNIERIGQFAGTVNKTSSSNVFYFGGYEQSVVKGLENCYDFGSFKVTSGGDHMFKQTYNGANTFILPRIDSNSSAKIFIDCNIPWTIEGNITMTPSNASSTQIDLSSLDFSKAVKPSDKSYSLLKFYRLSQKQDSPDYVPGLPNKVQVMRLFESCTIFDDFTFDALNTSADLDYGTFNEFYNCSVNSSATLTIKNLHLWDKVDLYIPLTMPAERFNIQLCPKDSQGRILEQSFSYLRLPYMNHEDEIIELTDFDPGEESVSNNSQLIFSGTYENCTYKMNIQGKAIKMSLRNITGDKAPTFQSDEEVYFDTQYLGSGFNINLESSPIKELHFAGLKLKSPTIKAADITSYLGYYYWNLPLAVNLEHIDMPPISGMYYNFLRCSKLDPQCILSHFRSLPGKAAYLLINKIVWDKYSPLEQSEINNKLTTLVVYENETT